MIYKRINMLDVAKIGFEAGKRIMEIYHCDTFEVELKGDESPLTKADRESHSKITEQLSFLYPNIPILSEEGDHINYEHRKGWRYVWLIDPLDGTKEFIKRNGEFTVNIGLVKEFTPILGVVYAPVLDTMYFANRSVGSYKLTQCTKKLVELENDEQLLNQSKKLPLNETRDSFNIVVSRSHSSNETEAFIERMRHKFGNIKLLNSGSALKMCLVAEGKVDIYPRFSQSMEWDTAAGEAIVKGSGGEVFQKESMQALTYNKENLVNPYHIVKKANIEV